MQHWTRSIGQAQQLLMEYATGAMTSEGPLIATQSAAQTAIASTPLFFHPELLAEVQSDFAKESIALWQRFLDGNPANDAASANSPAARKYLVASPMPNGSESPFYDLIRQSYLLLSDY